MRREGDNWMQGTHRHEVMKLCHETEKKPVEGRPICNPGGIHVHMRIAHDDGLHRETRSECTCFEGSQSFAVRGSRFGENHNMTPVVAHGFALDSSWRIAPRVRCIPFDSDHLHRFHDVSRYRRAQILVRHDDHRQMSEEDEERIRKRHMVTDKNRSFLAWSWFPRDVNPLKPAREQIHPRRKPDRQQQRSSPAGKRLRQYILRSKQRDLGSTISKQQRRHEQYHPQQQKRQQNKRLHILVTTSKPTIVQKRIEGLLPLLQLWRLTKSSCSLRPLELLILPHPTPRTPRRGLLSLSNFLSPLTLATVALYPLLSLFLFRLLLFLCSTFLHQLQRHRLHLLPSLNASEFPSSSSSFVASEFRLLPRLFAAEFRDLPRLFAAEFRDLPRLLAAEFRLLLLRLVAAGFRLLPRLGAGEFRAHFVCGDFCSAARNSRSSKGHAAAHGGSGSWADHNFRDACLPCSDWRGAYLRASSRIPPPPPNLGMHVFISSNIECQIWRTHLIPWPPLTLNYIFCRI